MADEKDATQGEGTEEQTEEKQTVTAEQFAELQKQLEETRRAQSGSDRTVAELKKLLEQERAEKENASKTAEEKFAERIAALEAQTKQAEQKARMASLRSKATDLLTEAGLKAPAFLDRLIGDDDEATEELVKAYIEDKQETLTEGRKSFAKENGRRVTGTEQPDNNLDYAKLNRLSDEEVKNIPADVLDAIMEAAMKK
jgi:hypothetical protein